MWSPPVSLCSASQETSFAYESTVKRWPTILTGVIDQLATLNGNLLGEDDKDKLAESKEIIQSIAGLIYEMRHDRVLPALPDVGLPSDTSSYNSLLTSFSSTNTNKWFTASWLYAECYMYRRLRTLFAATKHWHLFDPFQTQKMDAFRSSATGIMQLAKTMQELVKRGKPKDEELKAEWSGIMSTCLWGNATDLSLLTSLTHEDIQALQSVERGSDFILKNDLPQVWDHIKDLKQSRIDIVLDNSGFELYTDFVLADWLITLSPFCSTVVFHPKLIPWFVSDVQPHDFKTTISSLLDPEFFPANAGSTEEEKAALKTMVERWQRYVEEGRFKLSVPLELKMGDKGGELADFWTTAHPFSDLPEIAPALLTDLQKASLVIFKFVSPLSPVNPFFSHSILSSSLRGDLNYRKLTSDANWPTTTPFEDTLGPLKGKISILSLRTCKADVCVGLEEGKKEELDEKDPSWRVSGKYAVVSFSKKE
ncbi:damage-control phosphatase, subfamily III, partial [Phenoliferia sp. Uapishka_3]